MAKLKNGHLQRDHRVAELRPLADPDREQLEAFARFRAANPELSVVEAAHRFAQLYDARQLQLELGEARHG